MELCRLCLKSGEILYRFDETFVYQYQLLTNLKISLLDKMPQFSCNSCWDTVKHFIVFREKSIQSEVTLQAIFEQRSPNKQIELYSEILPLFELPMNTESIESHSGPRSLVDVILKEDHKIKNEEINIPSVSKALVEFPKEEDGRKIDVKIYEIQLESNTLNDFNPDSNENTLLTYNDNITKATKKKELKPKKTREKRIKEKNTEKLQNNLVVDKWFCGICPNTFETEDDVKRHLEIHKDARQCELCKLKVNSISQLLSHRLRHVPSKQFCCHVCAKRFRSCLPLEHHYRNMHFEGDDPKLACEICSSTFRTPKRLNYHKRQVHSSIRFFCDVCSKGFTSKGYLKSHIKHHSDTKSYVCDICGFSCNYSGGLKNHKIWRHSQKKIHCKNCNRPFSNQLDYDRHTCKARLKVCPVCGLQLTRRANLSRHMASHSDVYPYECKRCPAKYKTKIGLLAHINRHDGNRTKQCQYCPAKFYTTAVLTRHQQTHTVTSMTGPPDYCV